ncbi:MAG: hypothetical protein ABI963_13350, partial [Rhizomicrobium sp.]
MNRHPGRTYPTKVGADNLAAKTGEEEFMRMRIAGLAVFGLMTTAAAAQTPTSNDGPQPSCKMCEGVYIPAGEIQAYSKKAVAEHRIDQQVRDIDIGKVHIA